MKIKVRIMILFGSITAHRECILPLLVVCFWHLQECLDIGNSESRLIKLIVSIQLCTVSSKGTARQSKFWV